MRPDDHPLRGRLRLDRGGVARGRRAGRRPEACRQPACWQPRGIGRPPRHALPYTAAAFPSDSHLNLTLGGLLGRMPRLAAGGTFPGATRSWHRRCSDCSIRARSAARSSASSTPFETGLGFPPDHIDGHEHVHVLSGVRRPLLDVAARRYPRLPPLIRDPPDRWQAIAARHAAAQGPGVAALTLGLRLRRTGSDCRRTRASPASRRSMSGALRQRAGAGAHRAPVRATHRDVPPRPCRRRARGHRSGGRAPAHGV